MVTLLGDSRWGEPPRTYHLRGNNAGGCAHPNSLILHSVTENRVGTDRQADVEDNGVRLRLTRGGTELN